MKTITLPKASPIGEGVIEKAEILITEEVPDFSTFPSQAKRYYAIKAEELVDVLLKTCPGALIDAVLYTLLEKRASLFKVPFVRK